MSKRPSLLRSRIAFKEVYEGVNKTVSGVGEKIGGKVDYNINGLTAAQGRFENACAIRMSYVLNKTGTKIPFIKGKTVSGGGGNWYIYKVKDIIKFLHEKFGEPDITVNDPMPSDFSDYQGILVVEVSEWVDASGHATIWTGLQCTDHCYFPKANKAYLWTLKD